MQQLKSRYRARSQRQEMRGIGRVPVSRSRAVCPAALRCGESYLPDNSGRNNQDESPSAARGGGTVAGRTFIHHDAKEGSAGAAYRIAPPRDAPLDRRPLPRRVEVEVAPRVDRGAADNLVSPYRF